ncbi:MAG: biotin synthase BioB [Prevotellaceae bacterium]|jgi:biotin synthase|nr:biotin synthase BioB [Prevotellaceae bacterium]
MYNKIVGGYRVKYGEALELINSVEKEELYRLADALRLHFCKKSMDTCMIMNAKSGACPEDCKWCAQSAKNKTDIKVYRLVDYDAVLKDALIAQKSKVTRFGLVTSGRRPSKSEFVKISGMYSRLNNEVHGVGLCSSLGLLTKDELQKLYDSGVRRYHCNMETAPSFFPNLCSTHTVEEKIATAKAAKEVGMQLCSGGIIGMGESVEQRIELAILLQEIGADSIPVNILQPIKGTPLENAAPLTDDEVLTAFAMFRIINPEAEIRFAGGRASIGHIQDKALKCGVSASLVGDMLTTVGSKVNEDFAMFRKMGYEV